jgi:NAD(P)H dehydrogenase (quinone)
LPDGLAAAIAGWDAEVSKDVLFDNGHTLSRLIGHPITSLSQSVREAVAGLK